MSRSWQSETWGRTRRSQPDPPPMDTADPEEQPSFALHGRLSSAAGPNAAGTPEVPAAAPPAAPPRGARPAADAGRLPRARRLPGRCKPTPTRPRARPGSHCRYGCSSPTHYGGSSQNAGPEPPAHYLPWPDPVADHERTKPLLHPLVEQGPWPVAGPSAIVHTREQPLSPSGGNVLSAGQGVQRLRRLVNPYPTMGSGKDPRLEGRPKWRWTAVPRPSPTCCSAGGERSRPLKQQHRAASSSQRLPPHRR